MTRGPFLKKTGLAAAADVTVIKDSNKTEINNQQKEKGIYCNKLRELFPVFNYDFYLQFMLSSLYFGGV